jgi:hypothetical protein
MCLRFTIAPQNFQRAWPTECRATARSFFSPSEIPAHYRYGLNECPFCNLRVPMFGVKYREIKGGIFRMGTFWACSTLPFGISAPFGG